MKKRNLLLMLLLAIGLPWAANAQDLADYTFSTGTDNTQWITLSNGLTSIVSSGDDTYSSLTDIGFSFPFGDGTYTKFWANANGIFSFSSSPNGNYSNQFNSSNLSANQPKICGITRDMGVSSNGGYVKYELTGTAPNRVLVCEFNLQASSGSSGTPTVNFQVQLHENDSKVVLVYGAAASPSSFQIGLSQSTSDVWTINPSTHEATHSTVAVSATYSTWPGENRYYAFERPVIAYPKPTNLQVTGTDHESASFSWAAPEQGPNTLTGYAYQYKKASDTDWPTSWTSGVNASATTLTIHGLEASTSYNFRFKALYGSNESDIVTADFSTTAQATAVGDSWSDDFEGATCGWDLINGELTNQWCWGTAVNNGGTHAIYISNDNGTTNNYNTSGYHKVFATKLLNFADGKYTFSYDWKGTGESSYDFMRVALVPASQTLTAGTDHTTIGTTTLPTGWIALDGSNKLNQQSTWTTQEVAVNVAAGNYYLVLAWRQDNSGGTNPPAAVDNVSIVKLACPYDVEGLAVATTPPVTESTATVTWTAGDATQWQVAYSTNSSFEGATEEIVSSASYNMTGLTANTQYYVKVRAYCGGEDYGSWCNAISFYTECPQYTTIPAEGWTVNFDDMTGVTSGSTNNLPHCWNYINTSTSSSYQGYPVVYNGSSDAQSTPNYLRFYSYYYYPGDEYAILPAMQNVNTLRVKFYARTYSSASYAGTLHVGVMTDESDASTFVAVGDPIIPNTTTYQLYTVSLSSYTGTGTRIAIKMDAPTGSTSLYAYVDDITVEEIPSCLEPADLAEVPNTATSNSVTFGWTAVNNETTWKVQYKKSDATNWTTVSDPVTTNPYTLPGLDHSSTYQVRVAAWCTPSNPEGISEYCEPITVHTECEAITTFPINYGFETTEGFPENTSTPTTNQLGACWRNEATHSPSSGSYLTRVWGTSTYYHHGDGSQALVLPDKGNSSNPAKTMLVFPEMEFTSANGYTVSFWIYRSGSSSNPEGFKLYVSDCDTIGPNAVELGHYSRNYSIAYPDIVSSGWYQYETAPITRTGSVYIIFEGQSYYGSATYVDDIVIKEYVAVTADQIVETVSDPATEMTWNEFVSHWNNGDHFTSTTFTLMDDITVNTMVGTADKPFTGTFDGNSHTITVNLTATAADFTAPFRIIRNATIQNLKVNGTINDGGFKFCAGFAGDCYGNNTFTNCESAVTINATIEGDGTHGGFIARNYGGSYSSSSDLCTTVFNGCAFTGQLLGASTTQSAGFCGWSEYQSPNYAKTIFNNCLFAPQAVTMSTTNSAAFARRRNASYVNFNNCYFMQDFNDGTNNTAQGKQAYTITGVDPVYVAFSGEHTLYNMSGIDAYTEGMVRGYTKLAGEGDNVTLSLSGAPGYEADHGTLVANGETYTLTMEAYNTQITGVSCPVPYNVAVPAANLTARSAQVTWNGGSDSYTLQYREVITAAVDVNDTYGFEDNTLQGWTTISNDNDNNAWSVFNGSSYAHEGSYYVRSRYTSSSDGGDANDWLISPQITLGGTFSFYAKRYGTSYTDRFQVYISTTGNNISDFTAISEVITPNATYDKYEYDLSSYTGNGYVAIVYTAPNNQYYVYVDDITYTNHIDGEYGAWQTVNNAASPQTIESLTPETPYQVKVSGTCAGVPTDYSDVVEFTTLATCPAPTSLAVTNGSVTAHAATITWTENGEATTWIVEYADNADFTGALTETVEDNATYSFDELDGETTYYVRVKTHCGEEDESYYSNVVNFTTLVACPVPTVLTVTEITTTSAKLSWTENGTATAWQICLNGDETNLIPANSNPFVLDEGLTASTSYTVKVRANCGGIDGESGWSNTVNFATACGAITTFPWSQDFESFDNNTVPTCWDNSASTSLDEGTTNYYIWGVVTISDNNMIKMENYWAQEGTALINTPTIVLPAEGAYQFSFDYAHNASCGAFAVKVSTDNGTTFTELASYTKGSGTSHTEPGDFTPATISLENYAGESIILQFFANANYGDGAIFVDNVKITPVFTKTIEAVGNDNWAEGKGGYYLIASPLADDVDPTTVGGMITADEGDVHTYDLYSFDQAQDLEWLNYRANAFDLVNGKGYLYASKEGTTLTFTGAPGTNGTVDLTYEDATIWAGWNLVGNPFGVDAYLPANRSFYTLQNSDVFTPKTGEAIGVMEGVFVTADENEESLTFTTTAPSKAAKLNLNLTKDASAGSALLDRAIVRFDEGSLLPKLQFRQGSTKVYIPIDSKEYAVVAAENNVGEMPVSFKAEKNGSYTLSFTNEEVTFSYLHLIDNMTGNDVNLLETPNYSFDAKTTDYESRFRLVFATGTSVDNNTFGFVNASGNLCIFGIEGEATVQVIDMLGHVISSETFSGSYERKINGAPGVYMVRLINGDNVMVQKIVVR